MKNIINGYFLRKYWNPGEMDGHWIALGPMMSIHAMLQIKEQNYSEWCWNEKGVREALETIWNMTGSWKARRVKTFKKSCLEEKIAVVVPSLTATFNKYNVACMSDLGRLKQEQYEKVVDKIYKSIESISLLRKTRIIQPVLGSKVLHHYFPTIIPVFDEALVLKGGLQSSLVRAELQKGRESDLYTDGWICLENNYYSYKRMKSYYQYFGICAQQISEARNLSELRRKFASGFIGYMPHVLATNSRSMVYKMDAKIAEYCLLGLASKEELI